MLRFRRALAWTTDTIEEVLRLGSKIYEDNIRLVDGREVFPYDMVEPIKLGNSTYTVRSEPIVFGTLSGSCGGIGGNNTDLETGLKQFFIHHDAGHIQGPQSMAVWHELNYYFLFDAKERDALGRKWNENCAQAAGDAEQSGRACVSRFQRIDQLAAAYMVNIPLKNRQDSYRLINIELLLKPIVSEKWLDWRSIAVDTWILRGNFSQGNRKIFPDDDRRDRQGTCMAAIALRLASIELPDYWTKSTIDEILTIGDAYHAHSVDVLKTNERFIDYSLCVLELAETFQYADKEYRVKMCDCFVNGTILGTTTMLGGSDTMDLKRGKYSELLWN